ncbi:CopG family transcriptional regulator [Salmonella enterica subsp. enterica serovar Worthington]|nr:CopG family transcriptional regulator [Salmonella enterica subsp. enterica serovar Worthington]
MADKVDQMAARLERSRAGLSNRRFLHGLPAEEERNRLTLEAPDDVTSGQVIDHQAVQARSDSLSTDNPLPVPR